MNKFNDKNQKHGYWERYDSNGKLVSKGNFLNGLRHDHWEYYYGNGNLAYKGTYINGNQIGYWMIINNKTEFHL